MTKTNKTTQNFPFLETDFTKAFADLKVPGVDFETLAAAQRRNFEAITQANQLALEGFQAIARRQVEILQGLIADSTEVANQLTAEGTPEQKLAQQTDLLRENYEKSLANLKELNEMLAKSGAEASEVLNKRISEALKEAKCCIEDAKAKKAA